MCFDILWLRGAGPGIRGKPVLRGVDGDLTGLPLRTRKAILTEVVAEIPHRVEVCPLAIERPVKLAFNHNRQ